MADLLKDMYNVDTLRELALDVKANYDLFQVDEFLAATLDKSWEKLELKARMRQISVNLGKFLPQKYPDALAVLDRIVGNYSGFFGILFPDFVEVYGQDDAYWDLSVDALERYTPFSSSEFAVRPFILRDEERMMTRMSAWAKHKNEHLRRLASEGCRPALPWAQALPKYKKDPTPILPILEQLKNDSSLYVRKSVANNLNDISKTHPDLVAQLAKNWYGQNEYTNWIIKHGCRTLLKKGNQIVLALFGYHDVASLKIEDFTQSAASISIGEDITFSFTVSAAETTKIRLEYGVDYVKANGKISRKIFQISETSIKENEKKTFTKTHSFADLSVRKHYPGIHSITLIMNGAEQNKITFKINA